MKDKIEYLLKDFKARHSEFQIENFIIGQECTPWAKYRQALREINDRHFKLLEMKDRLELADLKFEMPAFGKRALIRKRMRERSRQCLVDDIRETERELKKFIDLAMDLKSQIGELTLSKTDILESDAWLQKAIRMAAVDLIIQGRLGQSTVGMILALPKRDREVALSKIKGDPNKLIGL